MIFFALARWLYSLSDKRQEIASALPVRIIESAALGLVLVEIASGYFQN